LAVLGSVSRSLAGSAPCPVVVVSPQASIALGSSPVVICGVDGSEPSGIALDHAAELAYALGGRLTAVHVSAEPNPLAVMATWGARTILPVDYARAAVEALATNRAAHRAVERAAARVDDGIPIRLRLEHGDVAARLRMVAAEYASAMLVVGSRGHGALRSALVGSVSSRLAANAPVPVMVVPPGLGAEAVGGWGRHSMAGGGLSSDALHTAPRLPRGAVA
jgi:nucleotide-binding universal stress UspA family protein